jgi:hypothetical protein
MVNNLFLRLLLYHQKLPGSQVGFRERKSCTDNLSILYGEIIKAFIKGNGTTGAFLDVKAAYDNVLPFFLDEKLKNVGDPPNLRVLVWHLGSERVLHLKYGALDEIRDRLCGLVVRVSGYRSRGPGFHSRPYQIF